MPNHPHSSSALDKAVQRKAWNWITRYIPLEKEGLTSVMPAIQVGCHISKSCNREQEAAHTHLSSEPVAPVVICFNPAVEPTVHTLIHEMFHARGYKHGWINGRRFDSDPTKDKSTQYFLQVIFNERNRSQHQEFSPSLKYQTRRMSGQWN